MKSIIGNILKLCAVFALSVQTVSATDFSAFLIDFFSNPANQSSKVSYPYTYQSSKVNNARAFKPVNHPTNGLVAVVCADSIKGASKGLSNKNIALLKLSSRSGSSFTFVPQKSQWKLKSGSMMNAKNCADSSFVSFLISYSQNNEYQMRHTVFPLPQLAMAGGKETSRKLQMPRDWNYVNFLTLCPELLLFENSGTATNRRLYFYRHGRLAQIYIFIKLRNQWMLIEVENY